MRVRTFQYKSPAEDSKSINAIFISVLKDPEEIKRFESEWSNSEWLREKIAKAINIKIKEANKQSISKKIYEMFNWKDFLADSIGYKRMGKEIISLLNKPTEVDHDL